MCSSEHTDNSGHNIKEYLNSTGFFSPCVSADHNFFDITFLWLNKKQISWSIKLPKMKTDIKATWRMFSFASKQCNSVRQMGISFYCDCCAPQSLSRAKTIMDICHYFLFCLSQLCTDCTTEWS